MDKRLLNELGCQSAGMQAICQDLAPCLNTGSPILFWGEAGIGMGFYARAIHAASRAGKLLRKPCFELDEAAFQEQLFGAPGHADWLEEYDQGTIFFKHITETSAAVQRRRSLRSFGCPARLVQRVVLSGALGVENRRCARGELAYDQFTS